MRQEHLESDTRILLSEFDEGAARALKIRPLLTYLGIRVCDPADHDGVVVVDAAANRIMIGGMDEIASKGPYARSVRAYTSALAWGFSALRLAKVPGCTIESPEVKNHAASFLCPRLSLELDPDLGKVRTGRMPVDDLAKKHAVDEWVMRRALTAYGLMERVLESLQGSRPAGGS